MDTERGGGAVGRAKPLSPADKARLPGALQFAAAFVFLLGMIGIWRMVHPPAQITTLIERPPTDPFQRPRWGCAPFLVQSPNWG